jgi:hypothetical protein
MFCSGASCRLSLYSIRRRFRFIHPVFLFVGRIKFLSGRGFVLLHHANGTGLNATRKNITTMTSAFIVLSEETKGSPFPSVWSGIMPVTYISEAEAQKFGNPQPWEWVEKVDILPNGAIRRSNGDIFTHDPLGRKFAA